MKKIIIATICLLIVIPIFASAKIGVGVGTGKIVVDQDLKSGLIYGLPSIVVLNTGDELSDYSIGIKHKEGQNELRPEESWFIFKPDTFKLEPGKSQMVEIRLSLPVKGVIPGDYFAFLSAYPISKIETGGTSLGIAAASKLYFTVAPTNFISGAYYRITSLFRENSPASYIILSIAILILVVSLFKKFFSLNLGISVKKK